MTTKKERLTDEELLALIEGIDDDTAVVKTPSQSITGPPLEADLFEELGISEIQRPSSRPHTPQVGNASSTTGARSSPKPPAAASPPVPRRSSEEKENPRKSKENTRPFHTSFAPRAEREFETEQETDADATPEAAPPQSTGGGWWGGIFATATAAVKQAEALANEIKQNEEAQRWAEQVKGNVGALRGLGGELRSRALPTFTNILHTLAPPISSHERLQIHITHDIIGYPSLDPIIYQIFSRVMAQVEGGDLMVIQRGQESSPRRSSDAAGFTGSGSGGWSDGPWWRQSVEVRNLGTVKGLVEGTKLSKVSAETYAAEYFSSRGGLEQAAKHAAEVLSESNPVRSSDIFLSIQAISMRSSAVLFGSSPAEKGEGEPDDEELISFAIYLHDPVHGITFSTITQTLPQRWIDWLDASPTSDSPDSSLPAEIAGIVQNGGMDPREWVAEWVEELLTLGIGIVAQRYVARRMGVGESGIGRGKARQQALESGGGEAARAV